jgi:histidine triad (HIT) family protein
VCDPPLRRGRLPGTNHPRRVERSASAVEVGEAVEVDVASADDHTDPRWPRGSGGGDHPFAACASPSGRMVPGKCQLPGELATLNLSCVFCSVMAGVTDPGVCLAVNNDFVVFPALHQRPSNRGHMLLVPADHLGGIADVPPEGAAPMLTALQATTQAVKSAFGASGTTVRLNLGPPAQGVFHLHWHVIPRYVGDDFTSARSAEVPLSERLQLTAKLGQHLPRRAAVRSRK